MSARTEPADCGVSKAHDLAPSDVDIMTDVARVLKERYNNEPGAKNDRLLEEADSFCRDALAVDPDFIKSLSVYGVILKMRGLYDTAMATDRRLTELQPDYFAGWVNLGTLQAVTGNLDAARASLELSCEAAPSCKPLAEETRSLRAYVVYPWRNLASLQLFQKEAPALVSIARIFGRYGMESLIGTARKWPCPWLKRDQPQS